MVLFAPHPLRKSNQPQLQDLVLGRNRVPAVSEYTNAWLKKAHMPTITALLVSIQQSKH